MNSHVKWYENSVIFIHTSVVSSPPVMLSMIISESLLWHGNSTGR